MSKKTSKRSPGSRVQGPPLDTEPAAPTRGGRQSTPSVPSSEQGGGQGGGTRRPGAFGGVDLTGASGRVGERIEGGTDDSGSVTDPNWPRDLRGRLSRLGKAGLEVAVELGRTRLPLEQVVNLEPGSLVELEKLSGQAVDVRVNGTLFGRGEIVVVGEQMAVRMTELLRPEEMK